MAGGYVMGRYAAPYYLNPAICIFNLEIRYFFASILGSFTAALFYRNFYHKMVTKS